MELWLYIVILIVFAIVIGLVGWIPLVGIGLSWGLMIFAFIFGWDPSLVWILCGGLIFVNAVAFLVQFIGGFLSGGLAWLPLLPTIIAILSAIIVGIIAFVMMIVSLTAGIQVTELILGLIIGGPSALVGSGLAIKKTKRKEGGCITVHTAEGDKEVCFGI